MKLACVAGTTLLLVAPPVFPQGGTPRAWQQRLELEIALPVPVIALETVNPFAIEVDQPPKIVSATPPKKVDVDGQAVVAAYVDPKGECLGGVPLELPFPGLTTPLLEELKSTKFDPGATDDGAVGSWVVLGIPVSGRVKEATVTGATLELPNPASPPAPAVPPQVAPSGLLLRAPYAPQGELTVFASPRRFKVKAPAREGEVPIRALVHITPSGRCDRYVPLSLESGLHSWLSAYLATWRLDPALRGGSPHEAWMVYSARAQLKLTPIESRDGVKVMRDRSFEPPSDIP